MEHKAVIARFVLHIAVKTIFLIYGVYNSSTLHNDHDKENIILKIKKKHWKLKYEKYTGFKAQMEKNRPIRDQFPNKNRVPIVKNPCFSWLYGLPMVP